MGWVVSFMPLPHYPWGKVPQDTLNGRLVGPHSQCGCFGEHISCPTWNQMIPSMTSLLPTLVWLMSKWDISWELWQEYRYAIVSSLHAYAEITKLSGHHNFNKHTTLSFFTTSNICCKCYHCILIKYIHTLWN